MSGVAADGGERERPLVEGALRNSALLVQFRAGTDFDAGPVGGWIDHVASGQTVRFDSATELLLCMAVLLKRT